MSTISDPPSAYAIFCHRYHYPMNIYRPKWNSEQIFKCICIGTGIQMYRVSLGDAGLRIESSTIGISSRPNLIVDYNLIPIPTTILCQRLRFQYKFDLFLIKVNHL